MNQDQILPMLSYPLSERLTLRPNRTDREIELAQAVEETTEFYLLPLIDRMEKLRSFWTASQEDLAHLSKQKWGELFDQIVVLDSDRRVFLWMANELRFVKNSVDAFAVGLSRLGWTVNTVTYAQLYHKKDTAYGTAFYTEEEALEMGTPNSLGDFVLVSIGNLIIDTAKLEAQGVNTANISAFVRQYFSNKVIPLHISAYVALAHGTTTRLKTFTNGIAQVTNKTTFVPTQW